MAVDEFRPAATARSWRVQGQQLLTESQIFKDEVLAGPESADDPPKDMPEPQVYGRKFIGSPTRACAKSFILWVYDDLASHSLPSIALTSKRCSMDKIERENPAR